jgi:hypothetical protein
MDMDKEPLNLKYWDALAPAEREAAAQALSQQLPAPWHFTGIKQHELGNQRHDVAFFDWNGVAFALIPGGEATLGYDRNNPFILNEAQRQNWDVVMEEFGCKFDEVMDEYMTPLRTVTLEPFLLEVEAKKLGVIPISDNADKTYPCSHRQIRQAISSDGFRFPTSDEWEYACAAGSRTLWRWGNDYPLHCYPGECDDWDLNFKPNAFGLLIACYPYNWEFVAEPGIMRGGDGGCAMCGGEGITPVWLNLASAFIDPYSEGEEQYSVHLRRAYSISWQQS